MAAPQLGTSSTFSFAGLTGNIMSIKADMYDREVIKTSHLGTTVAHTFMPGSLYDAGGCTIEFQMDQTVDYGVPAIAVASTLVINTPAGAAGAASIITVQAFMTALSVPVELETLIVCSATFKFTGTIVIT